MENNTQCGWRWGIGQYGDAFSGRNTYREVKIGTGSVKWEHLTWEQNPTQYHIVNALADLPILEYLTVVMTKCSTSLIVKGKPVRELK